MAKGEAADELLPLWRVEEVISETLGIDVGVADNVINLLEDGATIPFIARYRKEQTKDLEVEKLREIDKLVKDLTVVRGKINTVHGSISKLGKMTSGLAESLQNAQSLDEIEILYAPFKPGHKGTLAERAKKLGLEPTALMILDGKQFNLQKLVNKQEKELNTIDNVEKGIIHIIADIISKDKKSFDQLRKINVMLHSKETKQSTGKKNDGKKSDEKKVKVEKGVMKKEDSYKFEQYFDYKIPVRYIKPHQILAINRGESKKFLTVKIEIPDNIKYSFIRYCQNIWSRHINNKDCRDIIEKSINDAYDRLILPHACRNIRSDLSKKAEEASIKVFADNLKSLLLQPPIKGKVVLGVDPGFKNGCKSAVISPTGQVLDTMVFYLHDFKSKKFVEEVVSKYKCEVIAIGNGTACRETEKFISTLIQTKVFRPLDVYYTIVDESGASIYSCSKVAEKEFPKLDPTLRGAVSISRRLQDPLAELVKIEPKHIGVGMYQHDLSETKLKTSLDSVIEECVSFVGVDLNTGSECLLKRIAGLNATRAKNIVEWREKNNVFTNRQQLLSVKGVGSKSFEQCAGFIRIVNSGQLPQASTRFLILTYFLILRWSVAQLAASLASEYAHQQLDKELNVNGKTNSISEKYGTGLPTLTLIIDALTQTKYDIREGNQKPLFKQGITGIEDLKTQSTLTGRVTNVTHFGAFVDIGVGQDGLIHTSNMFTTRGRQELHLGDRVQVLVTNIDVYKKRIALKLLDVL
ncbi:hypothetical protein LOTGIDRAFT_136816 [Lottia gigantea]|uniref:S1 motif domain-containing protein n=1 Tax=Lottia gigantea TaxID=225164 RepID=V4B9L1_LOTGI|nr:hypothetical protein LOTGIDRAFT_136816 [Lottia gigantea]ESP04111.1 hypothetical protein LOTGIDRAFT_136816 [Lottia gigantea]